MFISYTKKEMVHFHNRITLLMAAVEDICTCKACPVMNVGPGDLRAEVGWADEFQREPVKISAPAYYLKMREFAERKLRPGVTLETK